MTHDARPSSDRDRPGHRRPPRHVWLPRIGFALVVLAIGIATWLFASIPPERTVPKPVTQATPAAPEPTAAAPSERTAALPPLSLPADEAPHGSAMEWWYYNGILDGDGGQRYAFHVAVFVASSLVRHTVMHVALTDLQSGKRFHGQYKTAGLAIAPVANGFDFRQGDWRFASTGTSHVLKATLGEASFALDLGDAPPVVAHRAAGSATPGLLDFGASGISYYYSRPRLPAGGTVTVGGQAAKVRGKVWFDHQWGEFDVLDLGWNWLALHLSDGSDLMVYELFDRQGRPVTTAGTRTTADGTSTPLSAQTVQLQPVRRWTSPATGITYPVAWRVQLPTGAIDVEPFHPDAEFDAGSTSANVYWEGAVKATGALAGEGFLELSGYERLRPAAKDSSVMKN